MKQTYMNLKDENKVVKDTGCNSVIDDTGMPKGINIGIYHSQSAGHTNFTATGTTITGKELMYDLDEVQRRYDISYPQLNRWIDTLRSPERYNSCMSYGKKHFVTEEIFT